MDEVGSHVRLDLPFVDGKAAAEIVPPCPRIPPWKGLGVDSEEKHEPGSDIEPVVVDGLEKRLTSNGRLEKRTWHHRVTPPGLWVHGLV